MSACRVGVATVWLRQKSGDIGEPLSIYAGQGRAPLMDAGLVFYSDLQATCFLRSRAKHLGPAPGLGDVGVAIVIDVVRLWSL